MNKDDLTALLWLHDLASAMLRGDILSDEQRAIIAIIKRLTESNNHQLPAEDDKPKRPKRQRTTSSKFALFEDIEQ